LDLPLFIKARFSKIFLPKNNRIKEINEFIKVDNIGQFRFAVEFLKKKYPWLALDNFVVQQFIGGQGIGVSTVFNAGKPGQWFVHKRIREENVFFGRSAMCESVPDTSKYGGVIEKLEQMLVGLHFDGPVMAEFRDSGSRIFLMEINPRFWGSLSLAVKSGLNFPYYYLSGKLERETVFPKAEITKVRMSFVSCELNYLSRVLAAKDMSWNKKILYIKDFLKSYKVKTHIFNLYLQDILPFFWEVVVFFWRRILRVKLKSI